MNEAWFLENKKQLMAIDSPILPCVQEALKMLDLDELDIDQVVSCISKDPMLCAKLLMMANSPFYGLPREVSNLNEVIVILGAYKLKSLIITGSVEAWKGETENNMDLIWKHSLAVACFCEHFAKKIEIDEQDAYLLGLLHEVILFKLNDLDLPENTDIEDVLSFCMPKMLEIWGFPISLIQSVQRFYTNDFKDNDILPLAHSVANSLLFSHNKMSSPNILKEENLCNNDFNFWLHDSNDVVKHIQSLRY